MEDPHAFGLGRREALQRAGTTFAGGLGFLATVAPAFADETMNDDALMSTTDQEASKDVFQSAEKSSEMAVMLEEPMLLADEVEETKPAAQKAIDDNVSFC